MSKLLRISSSSKCKCKVYKSKVSVIRRGCSQYECKGLQSVIAYGVITERVTHWECKGLWSLKGCEQGKRKGVRVYVKGLYSV